MNDKFRKSWIVFFSIVFVIGFVLGSFLQKNERASVLISDYSLNLINNRTYGEAVKVFIGSLALNAAVMLLILAFNKSRLSAAFKAFVLFINGVGEGAVISNIVCTFGTHGLIVSTVVFMPGMITAACAAILLAALSLNFKAYENYKICFKQRFYTLIIYVILIFFSAGLDVSFAKLGKALL